MDELAYLGDPQQVIRGELSPNEKLLWSGQPPTGFRLRSSDAMLIPFSIMWGGFAIFWVIIVFVKTPSHAFSLWGVPFAVMGLYLMMGRFFVDAYLRARTFYGITSERILIIIKGFWPKTTSLNIDSMGNLTMTEKRNGGVVIEFGALTPVESQYRNVSWSGYASTRFELGEDGRKVYEIIRSTQQGRKT